MPNKKHVSKKRDWVWSFRYSRNPSRTNWVQPHHQPHTKKYHHFPHSLSPFCFKNLLLSPLSLCFLSPSRQQTNKAKEAQLWWILHRQRSRVDMFFFLFVFLVLFVFSLFRNKKSKTIRFISVWSHKEVNNTRNPTSQQSNVQKDIWILTTLKLEVDPKTLRRLVL